MEEVPFNQVVEFTQLALMHLSTTIAQHITATAHSHIDCTHVCTFISTHTYVEALRTVACAHTSAHLSHTITGEAYDCQLRRVPYSHVAVGRLRGCVLGSNRVHFATSCTIGDQHCHCWSCLFGSRLLWQLHCVLAAVKLWSNIFKKRRTVTDSDAMIYVPPRMRDERHLWKEVMKAKLVSTIEYSTIGTLAVGQRTSSRLGAGGITMSLTPTSMQPQPQTMGSTHLSD